MNIPVPHVYFSVICGMFLLGVLLLLIRNQRLQERYAVLWILLALAFITYGLWIRPIRAFADRFQIADVVSVILFLGIFMCMLLILQLSIKISEFSIIIKNLVQEISLLKYEMDRRGSDTSKTQGGEDGHL